MTHVIPAETVLYCTPNPDHNIPHQLGGYVSRVIVSPSGTHRLSFVSPWDDHTVSWTSFSAAFRMEKDNSMDL